MIRRERVFRKGDRIKTVADLDGWTFGGGWTYLANAPKHPLVMANMTLGTLRALIRGGSLFKAIRQSEE